MELSSGYQFSRYRMCLVTRVMFPVSFWADLVGNTFRSIRVARCLELLVVKFYSDWVMSELNFES